MLENKDTYYREGETLTNAVKYALDIPSTVVKKVFPDEGKGIANTVCNTAANIYQKIDRALTEFGTSIITRPLDVMVNNIFSTRNQVREVLAN